MITPFIVAFFLIGLLSTLEASARERGMVRSVKFLCTDVASIEVVGKAILEAHRNEGDEDAAARRAATTLIEAGSCIVLSKRAEVQLRRVMKWLSQDMAIWEVKNLEGRTRYALSLPVMDQLSGAKAFRLGSLNSVRRAATN